MGSGETIRRLSLPLARHGALASNFCDNHIFAIYLSEQAKATQTVNMATTVDKASPDDAVFLFLAIAALTCIVG